MQASVQAEFDGYHYYPIGGGRPIPFTIEKETLKDKKPAVANLSFKNAQAPNRIEFNLNQPIRIIDNSKPPVEDKVQPQPVIEPAKAKILNRSINFGFSRRQRNDYIANQLDKSNLQLNQSVSDAQPRPQRANSFIKMNPYADD